MDADVETTLGFLEDEPMPWVNWYAGPDHALITKWNIVAYPTYLLIDETGALVMRSGDFEEEIGDEARKLVARLDANLH